MAKILAMTGTQPFLPQIYLSIYPPILLFIHSSSNACTLPSILCLFTHPSIHYLPIQPSSIHSPVHHPSIHSPIPSLFINSSTYPLKLYPFICPYTYLPIHLLTPSIYSSTLQSVYPLTSLPSHQSLIPSVSIHYGSPLGQL